MPGKPSQPPEAPSRGLIALWFAMLLVVSAGLLLGGIVGRAVARGEDRAALRRCEHALREAQATVRTYEETVGTLEELEAAQAPATGAGEE